MKKQILLLTLLLSVAASSFAVEAEINGLWYELISKAKEATVIQYKNSVKYRGNIVIPETVEYNGANYSVTSIGGSAFYECRSLTSITIPNSVTSIGHYAFHRCSGLTSVTIPNSVTSIGDDAFSWCSGLTSVTVPNSVTSIGQNAFSNCDHVISVHISDLEAWCNISFGDSYSNPLLFAQSLFINGEEVKDLVIPNSVTSIRKYAFSNFDGMTSVTIGNSVTYIGEEAFLFCKNLTSVTIPNSVTRIGERAFYGCSGLTSVHISDIAAWCKIYFDAAMTNEYYYSNPLYFAHHLFLNGEEIKDLVIPGNVTSIGTYTFTQCSGLTSITIPNSVTNIEYHAFDGCNGLTTITIGSGVKNIGSRAFANCLELTDVYCYAEKMLSTNSDAFDGSLIEYVTLHVPTSSIDAYRAVEPWKSFKTIMGLDGTMPETPKCATPAIAFVNGELTFSCETEGVEYAYEITNADVKKGNSDKVKILGTYIVSVYAMKTGYDNSDVVTKEFTVGSNGEVCDTNRDGTIDVADIATIIDRMAGK